MSPSADMKHQFAEFTTAIETTLNTNLREFACKYGPSEDRVTWDTPLFQAIRMKDIADIGQGTLTLEGDDNKAVKVMTGTMNEDLIEAWSYWSLL